MILGGYIMNDDLKQALHTAKARCEGNIIIDDASINGFEKIYPFTTENITVYIDFFDLKDKSLLTVGSSGDQVINAALKGVKEVTLLDINPYTKYYFYLKQAGILELNLAQFNDFFRYNDYPKFKYNKKVKVFNNDSYKKLKSTLQLLDNDAYLFWDELFDMYSPRCIRFFLFSKDENPYSVLSKSSLYLRDENNYNETKTKIKNLRPEFINEDILDVNLAKNYDNIWLSNIACYLHRNELKKVTDNFAQNLNDDGQLLISYLYRNCRYTHHNLKANLELLKEYSLASYYFEGIDGIKSYDDTKDAVLVYQKKRK